MRSTLTVLVLLAAAASAGAQPPVFLVRHAERADAGSAAASAMAADPELSAAGRTRAESLARHLRDAGITSIYVTKYKRTVQTADPLARALGIRPLQVPVPATDPAALLDQIKAAPGAVLVVGHSNTIPELIQALGVRETVTIGEQEFDNLFIVVPAPAPVLLRLRY